MNNPDSAVPRTDLPFLSRRSRPRPAPTAEPSRSAAPIDYTHHSSAKRPQTQAPSTPASSAPASTPSAARPKIDFSRPARSPAPAPSRTDGIDFRRPGRDRGSNSLDLSDGGTSPTAASPARARPPAEVLARFKGPRVRAGEQLLLGRSTPAATLSRVQSGVGRLSVEAVCSPEVGDLRLGALYQFRSGGTSTVQFAGGNRFAPSSRRPVIVASRDEYEHLAVDLRQIRDIERLTVYAFSESRAPLTWGGTLVITTFGGGRIELPIESLPPAAVAVLVSLYNLAGEIVIRTELDSIDGDIREASRAYGYDRITWRDDRSPVD